MNKLNYPYTFNKTLLKNKLTFSSGYKIINQKGNLVYEYNPFRNYRLLKYEFEYKESIYTIEELFSKFQIFIDVLDTNNEIIGSIFESSLIEQYLNLGKWIWKQLICINGQCTSIKELSNNEAPILRKKGELVDFETNELHFDINHPIDLLPQYSYDGSVNLIINDGKNTPRLINSRFSPIGKNKYQIIDRKGDNDTNIYDLGDQFNIDTSLYKTVNNVPKLYYYGTIPCGNLKIGNYHFYFKYVDADGNESDFIAESGLVSIFIGELPYNINSGFRDLNSYKGVSFRIDNIDKGYQYISVYYTKSTSDINQNATTSAFKIDLKFVITSYDLCNIKITGFEPVNLISLDEINEKYQIAKSVNTQEQCLNILFFGNIEKNEVNYKELTDISLRFLPKIKTEPYKISDKITEDYEPNFDYNNSYYNSKFIYDKVGYWPGELYRFGIVYIMQDNTLSPVFNVRGLKDINNSIDNYSNIPFTVTDSITKKLIRNYINYDEKNNLIINSSNSINKSNLENCKGVISIEDSSTEYSIYGIDFLLTNLDNSLNNNYQEIINKLKELGVKGFFFVRQKRIPTTLCLAFTIGIDKLSHTPVIPYDNKYLAESFLDLGKIIPDLKGYLVHEYDNRIYELDHKDVNVSAICPDYDINNSYYNTIFNGDKFIINKDKFQPGELKRLSYDNRYYYFNELNNLDNTEYSETINIQAIEDNVKLSAIDTEFFSSRAGEAEEAFRFEYLKTEIKETESTNLVRGCFGPFLGFKDATFESSLVNIKIPNYNKDLMNDYFSIRYDDKSPYYAINDRISINNISSPNFDCYRGDCYICLFTHRINRNFQSPSAPTNDIIVDEKCWKDNYKVEKGIVKKENFDKINLGDVNAVELGQWVTIVVRSTNNLNIRGLDNSNIGECTLFGHPRTFYPYSPISAKGVYKIPESLCFNDGFTKSLSQRINFEIPDVPALKNDFTNRIIYSDIHVNDAFRNGYRTFRLSNYRDYTKSYGLITKLVELKSNLICVFEHGIAIIPINERVLSGQGAGGNVFVNTNKVLPETLNIISDTFGSQWKDSIIKTDNYIYGVDTNAKKIWRTDGQKFENISDFRVQEFLNQNITLTEREITPIIGIRNVKTHFNKYKRDVMFTFYDNLTGFKEKVWNLCFNELLNKWVTFYSWIPSYSENIYNSYFSFDRNTSKYISKLGISNEHSDFADGIVLSNNIISLDKQFNTNYNLKPDLKPEIKIKLRIGKLNIINRNIPKESKNIDVDITYDISDNSSEITDVFKLTKEGKDTYLELKNKDQYYKLCSELYKRGIKKLDSDNQVYYPEIFDIEYKENNVSHIIFNVHKLNKIETSEELQNWINYCVNDNILDIIKDEKGVRVPLDKPYNINNLVSLINIKAKIKVTYKLLPTDIEENQTNSFNNNVSADSSEYKSTIAVTTKYNMQFLTTDFWKHGLSNTIDISDKIEPTKWYGKLHPFEFDFIVADNPQIHKVFDNLEIISNNAEPESFHYEIVGDSYNFANDKKNMYIRQEATKRLYNFNNVDTDYDPDFINLLAVHRPIDNNKFDKSTIFPLYYSRSKSVNEIEDYYHLKDGYNTKNYSNLSGSEIVRNKTLDEYRICSHSYAVDLQNSGRLRGNMLYKEDKWYIQINPINIVLKNESQWKNNKIPLELSLCPYPNKATDTTTISVPDDLIEYEPVVWNWEESLNNESKIKDKWIKIRIRYSGKKLAVISAIKTLYTVSYA